MSWSSVEFWFEVVKVVGLVIGFATVIIQNTRQHNLTNSRMNQLLVAKTSQAAAEGKLEGMVEAEKHPKELIGKIAGEIVEAGKPVQEVTGEIKGELHPKESKTRQKKLKAATVKRKKKP